MPICELYSIKVNRIGLGKECSLVVTHLPNMQEGLDSVPRTHPLHPSQWHDLKTTEEYQCSVNISDLDKYTGLFLHVFIFLGVKQLFKSSQLEAWTGMCLSPNLQDSMNQFVRPTPEHSLIYLKRLGGFYCSNCTDRWVTGCLSHKQKPYFYIKLTISKATESSNQGSNLRVNTIVSIVGPTIEITLHTQSCLRACFSSWRPTCDCNRHSDFITLK